MEVMWWSCGGHVAVMWWSCGGHVVVMWRSNNCEPVPYLLFIYKTSIYFSKFCKLNGICKNVNKAFFLASIS